MLARISLCNSARNTSQVKRGGALDNRTMWCLRRRRSDTYTVRQPVLSDNGRRRATDGRAAATHAHIAAASECRGAYIVRQRGQVVTGAVPGPANTQSLLPPVPVTRQRGATNRQIINVAIHPVLALPVSAHDRCSQRTRDGGYAPTNEVGNIVPTKGERTRE